MNTIILNDTRSDQHIGCELVVSNSLRKCKEHGLNVISTISTADASKASQLLRSQLDQVDLVLLNGEGTLHDDQPNALHLLKAAKLAKASGVKVVLYNAHWSDNPKGKQYLENFDLIYCRDHNSLNNLLADSPEAKAQMVPDMTFVTEFPQIKDSSRSGILVTDSVNKKKCVSLSKLALRHKLEFAPMGLAFYRRLKKRHLLRYRISKNITNTSRYHLETPEQFLTKLLTAQTVVTGRFHTACLCILCNTPVFCISSNTNKIESLFHHFELQTDSIKHDLPALQFMEDEWMKQSQRRVNTQRIVKDATQKIEIMFQEISALT